MLSRTGMRPMDSREGGAEPGNDGAGASVHVLTLVVGHTHGTLPCNLALSLPYTPELACASSPVLEYSAIFLI
jgi:hypothetical protein